MDVWLLVNFLIFLSLLYLAVAHFFYFLLIVLVSSIVFYRRWAAFKADNKLPSRTLEEHLKVMEEGLRNNNFHKYSAVELSKMIREQIHTSEEIVRAHIEHLQTINPMVNAIAKDRFEEAIKEAKEVDKQIKQNPNGKFPPLFGVPFTVKECFALKGMPRCAGLHSKRDYISDEDATTVHRYKKAGAIPLCVTNTSELCMWMESNNKVYGRTLNPYNPTRTVGGSSGGEGCVIGSGASPFGIGSDIGGSIRMPAFFNGVFGHKPSGGFVPGTGQYPMAQGKAARYLTTGPLCRHASDLLPLLEIIVGSDGFDHGCNEVKEGFQFVRQPIDFSKVKIYWIDENNCPGTKKVSEDMKNALHLCVKHMKEKFGCEIIHASKTFPELKYSFDIWSSMLQEGNPISFTSLMADGKPFSAHKEFLLWLLKGSSVYTLPALGLCVGEELATLLKSKAKRDVEKGLQLKKKFEEVIDQNSIIFYPSYPEPAPKHGKPLVLPVNYVYTGIWNMMEAPVTQVPLGLNKQGIPLGVQVVGAHGNDYLTISVAQELEKAFGGWTPPSQPSL